MKTGEHWNSRNSRNSGNSYKRSRFWVAESEQLQWQTSWWFRLRETCDILTSLPAKLRTIKFSMEWKMLPTPVSSAACLHESLKTLSAQPTRETGGGEIIWSWALPRHFGQHHDKTNMAPTFLCAEDVFLWQRRQQAGWVGCACVKYFTKEEKRSSDIKQL